MNQLELFDLRPLWVSVPITRDSPRDLFNAVEEHVAMTDMPSFRAHARETQAYKADRLADIAMARSPKGDAIDAHTGCPIVGVPQIHHPEGSGHKYLCGCRHCRVVVSDASHRELHGLAKWFGRAA